MLSHTVAALVHRRSVKRAFVVDLIFVVPIFMDGSLPAECGKVGVMGADGIAGRHAKAPAWRADSFGDRIKCEVFDKVASYGAGFKAFGLVHSV